MGDCNLGPKYRYAARDYGWNYKTGKDSSDWLIEDDTTGAEWDSTVHASFQLGGAFSEKTLTAAEGVKAIDAIPVLHMTIGATQPDALGDVTGDRSSKSFYRERLDTIKFPNKRRLSQNAPPTINKPCERPTLRASKQQKLGDLLTGFETRGSTPRSTSRGLLYSEIQATRL